MGCCGNLIGDTPRVIPFKRMSQIAPLSSDAPLQLSCQYGGVADGRQSFSRSPARVGRKAKPPSLLKRINRHAAGIDCGSETHFRRCAVGARFRARSFVQDLHQRISTDSPTGSRLCKIKTVAMESTGVYWIPIFEILEERGVEVVLVNSRHVKNVPGRKSDVLDCQWIQELHSVGLLRGSFRPTAEIALVARVSSTSREAHTKTQHRISGACRRL